jgi:MFS family permease
MPSPSRPTATDRTASDSARPAAGLTGAGLAVLITAVFLPQVDFFIVNVALPTIQSALGASAGALELVVAGYGTAYAATLVLGGRLGDMIGRRRMLLIGLSGFVVTSLVCGTAPGIGVLLAARILQGAAAGLVVPQVIGTLHATLSRLLRQASHLTNGETSAASILAHASCWRHTGYHVNADGALSRTSRRV